MPVCLKLKSSTTIPLEVEGITPARCAELSLKQIADLEMYHGNRTTTVGEWFDVSGDASDQHLRFEGDCSGVHWIGAKMDGGQITIAGNGGRHIGSEMTAGQILVEGNVGDWLGGELHGGRIHVHGNAGHLVGSAYRGSRVGMRGGEILVHGDAGNEIGHSMRRGLIAIGGRTGDLIGFNMRAGTILAFGETGIRHGAGMRRGTIGLLGDTPTDLLLTFRPGCVYASPVMQMILRRLEECGYPVPSSIRQRPLQIHHGDMLEGGRGEIFVCA
ncbi:MAG: formylmethanofuran dehydrogenase subunit C [Pirellulaceae bacterium]